MPLTHHIDHGSRLVIAAGHGLFSDEDVFGYQSEVWSRDDVHGYDELVDLTDVSEIVHPTANRMMDLASLASRMPSSNTSSRLAIVAPSDLAFGLARMFQGWRNCADAGKRNVAVFRSMPEALKFLGLAQLPGRSGSTAGSAY